MDNCARGDTNIKKVCQGQKKYPIFKVRNYALGKYQKSTIAVFGSTQTVPGKYRESTGKLP